MLCGLPRVAGSRGSSLVAVCRLLMAVACLVVAHGLSCSLACGIFLDQGLNPCLLQWQAESLPLSKVASSSDVLKDSCGSF